MATTPVLLAAVSSAAFGQGLPAQVVDILNFALTLEYLEDEFYRTALAQPGLIPGQFQAVFQTISQHETEHVQTLSGALGGAAIAKPQFDLTGHGKYPDILHNFRTFAAVSQTLGQIGIETVDDRWLDGRGFCLHESLGHGLWFLSKAGIKAGCWR